MNGCAVRGLFGEASVRRRRNLAAGPFPPFLPLLPFPPSRAGSAASARLELFIFLIGRRGHAAAAERLFEALGEGPRRVMSARSQQLIARRHLHENRDVAPRRDRPP